MALIHTLLNLYLLVLVGRDVLSWIPLSPGSALAPVASFLYAVTEPVLAPLRRVIPPMGGFDLSFLVVFLFIQLVNSRI
ncbi:MAG: YggT family protein [Acidimicrobiaceae bacterium]|nr:YggT family protein [Acidimicrobiaceae bacterium]